MGFKMDSVSARFDVAGRVLPSFLVVFFSFAPF